MVCQSMSHMSSGTQLDSIVVSYVGGSTIPGWYVGGSLLVYHCWCMVWCDHDGGVCPGTIMDIALRKASPEQVLTPVMPGVNLPWSHISYYLFTLTLAGAVHEIGHALAAVSSTLIKWFLVGG